MLFVVADVLRLERSCDARRGCGCVARGYDAEDVICLCDKLFVGSHERDACGFGSLLRCRAAVADVGYHHVAMGLEEARDAQAHLANGYDCYCGFR